MHISIVSAKSRLSELMRRAEAGEEVFLTHDGEPVAQLVAIPDKDDKQASKSGRVRPKSQA